jgi:hypothetical protein
VARGASCCGRVDRRWLDGPDVEPAFVVGAARDDSPRYERVSRGSIVGAVELPIRELLAQHLPLSTIT